MVFRLAILIVGGLLGVLSIHAQSSYGTLTPNEITTLMKMVIIEHEDYIDNRNKLVLYLDGGNSCKIDGELYDQESLRKRVFKFLTNMGKDYYLSENPQEATIVLDFERMPDVSMGLSYLGLIRNYYGEVRNAFSQFIFQTNYDDLSIFHKQVVDDKCPHRVILAYVESLHYHRTEKGLATTE